MSFSQAEAAIEKWIKDRWLPLHPDIPLLWQNKDNQIPALPYIHLMIIGEHEEIAAFGGGRKRNELLVDGRIECRVFVPFAQGASRARALRDELAALLRYERFEGVSCRGASPVEGGTAADRGNAYFVTVVVDFEYRYRG